MEDKAALARTGGSQGVPIPFGKKSIPAKKSKKKKGHSYSDPRDCHRRKFGLPPFVHSLNSSILKSVKRLHTLIKSNKMGKDIPFNWAELFSGIQAPTIRLYFIPDDIVSATAVANADVFSIIPSNFNNWTELSTVFDEYRPIGGEMELYSICQQNITTGAAVVAYQSFGVGVIDYDNNTAFTVLNDGVQYDSKKFFRLLSEGTGPHAVPCTWPVILEKLPDQQWIDCASPATAAYLKIFVPAAFTVVTGTVATVTGWMDFQFRNSD